MDGDAFCNRCGSRTEAPTESAPATDTAWSEERKLATIVFGDIVGFTKVSAGLEADEVWELANEALEPLSRVVREHGGTVVKYIGDCIMAVFGVPLAAEDDPRRAVRAALAMRARVRKLSPGFEARYRAPLSMRIGVHTGEVMVARLASDGGGAPDVMGAAVNLASRVESLCQPGEVLISQATWRLVEESFDTESLGPLSVKGVDEPLFVHRVVRETPEGRSSRRAVDNRLFLRQPELRALARGFDKVLETERSVTMRLVAESGLGKNRLTEELRRVLKEKSPRPENLWSKGTVGATANTAPLHLIGGLIRNHFSVRADEASDEARARVIDGIRSSWPKEDSVEAERAAVILADLAQLTGGREPEAPSTDPGSAGKDRLFIALVSWLERLSAKAPVCIFLVELQWADEASLDLVERLVGSIELMPVFLLLGHQPILEERRRGWPSTNNPLERVDLAPLTTAQIRRLIDDSLTAISGLPEPVKEELATRAEGNPEYAIEMIRLLIDRGAIVLGNENAPGRWHGERLGELGLPDTIMGVVQARMDGLPPKEKDLLKRASLIGRSFWRRALLATYDEPIDLSSLLLSLVQKEIIRPYESAPLLEEDAFRFRAQAFRDVAFRSIPRSVREHLHKRVAEWLENHAKEWEGGYAELAGHLDAAGFKERARGHHIRAARHALSVHDNRNATAFYSKALDAWPADSEYEEKAAARRELAAAYARLGRFEEALESLSRADEDLRSAGLKSDDAVFAHLDLEQARLLKERGQIDAAMESIDRGLARVAERDPALLDVWLHGQRAHLLSMRADPKGAREHCEKGRRIVESLQQRDRPWDEAAAMVSTVSGLIHMHAKETAQAEESFRRAIDLFGSSDPRSRLTFEVNLGALAFDRGDFDRAAEHFGKAMDLSHRLNWPKHRAVCQSNLGQALLAIGRLGEAMDTLEGARRQGEQGGYLDVLADSAIALSQGWLKRGDPDRALALALDAIAYAERAGQSRFTEKGHGMAMDCLLAGASPLDPAQTIEAAAREHLEAASAILLDSSRPDRELEIEALRARFEAGLRKEPPGD